jgi:hypothetical protein
MSDFNFMPSIEARLMDSSNEILEQLRLDKDIDIFKSHQSNSTFQTDIEYEKLRQYIEIWMSLESKDEQGNKTVVRVGFRNCQISDFRNKNYTNFDEAYSKKLEKQYCPVTEDGILDSYWKIHNGYNNQSRQAFSIDI